ncbi:helix-turn-helix domain-containing protein [Moheibacter sediminis]|uniref:helix-turn-helix domain-containing protein n=1 Tax=Moheibacter sediminis TaxID=1434700 RepID=UPI0013566B16|nr:response regulator transcription factor [Moheibacter sediminis]
MKILIILFLLSALLQAQSVSRNEKILQESSELIYENLQEAQRLLSFVNHSNSEKEHRILSLLILADASYLKGDFVAVMNYIYHAQELLDEKDSDLKFLVEIYLSKYYRILGFQDLSNDYLGRFNQKEILSNYNIKPQILLEKAIRSDNSNEKLKLLNLGFNQLDTTKIFGNSLKNEFRFQLIEISQDSSEKYLKEIIDSKSKIFSARAYLQNENYLMKADSLLKLNPDVILQLELHEKLAKYYLKSNQKDLYKQNILERNELENIIDQSKIKARDLVISHIENQRKEEKSVFENYLFWILTVLVLLSLYGVFYYLKTKRDYKRFLAIMQKNQEEQREKLGKTNSIPEKTEQLLLKKLEKFEQSQKFIQPDISLTNLAKSLDTNTKYLSDIINRNKGCNFNQYINEHRINYIIEKMKSEPKYLNYKMFYLAQECGFSSQSSFSTVFKSVTGISPLSFIKFLKNERKAD